MKKGSIAKKILAVVLMTAMLPCSFGSMESAEETSLIFSETFSDGAAQMTAGKDKMTFDEYGQLNEGKWELSQGATSYTFDTEYSIIREPGNTNNFVAQIYRPTSDSNSRLCFMNCWLDKTYNTPIIYKFRINRVNTQSATCTMHFYDSQWKIIDIPFNFRDKRFGSGYFTKDEYVSRLGATGWYDMECAIDFTKQTLALYMKAPGETKLSYVTTLTIAEGKNSGDIKRIAFGTSRDGAGAGAVFYFDDISIEHWNDMTVTGCQQNVELNDGVDVYFSNKLDAASLEGASFDVADDAATVKSYALDANDNRKVHVTFEEPLDTETQYTLEISGVKDMYGRQQKTMQTVGFKTRDKKLNLKSVKFYKDYSGAKTEITNSGLTNGEITGVLHIDNELSEPFQADIIMAHIRDGKVLDITTCDKNEIAKETEDSFQASLNISSVENGDILQLFAWDSIRGMKAVLGSYFLDKNGIKTIPLGSKLADQTTVSVSMDYEEGVVSVSGTVQPQVSDATVTALALSPNYTTENITKTNIADAVEFIAQMKSGDDGAFGFSYASDNRSNTESRMVVAGGNNISAANRGSVSFKYFEADILEKTLNAIKNASTAQIAELLSGSVKIADGVCLNDVLQIDLSTYHCLINQETAHASLAGKTFTTIEQVRESFNNAVSARYTLEAPERKFVVEVNQAPWDELEALLKKYDSDLKIDWDGAYQKLKSDEIALLYKKLALDNTLASYEDVRKKFSEIASDILSDRKPEKSTSTGSGGSKTKYLIGGAVQTPNETELPLIPPETTEPVYAFHDIADVSWAIESIEALAKQKIIDGVGEGRFEPNGKVTREQFVKMLMEAFGLEKSETGAVQFVDVEEQAWYYPYVIGACACGLVQGMSDNSFGTGREITRAEMAVLAKRAAALAGIRLSDNAAQSYSDEADIPDYALESVAAMQSSGIMNGVEEGRFAPNDGTTRAMAAKVIYGLLTWKGNQ